MKYIVILFLLFWALNTEAQVELSSTFNSTYSGRNVSLALSKTWNGKHELGLGVGLNLNRARLSEELYRKRLHATEFLHHFRVHSFYHYHLLKSWESVHPFLFYDLQASYSKSRFKDSNSKPSEEFGPYAWMEQCIGLGFKADLPGNFFITQKIGAGASFIIGKDKNLLSDGFVTEIASLINVGIGYRFQ